MSEPFDPFPPPPRQIPPPATRLARLRLWLQSLEDRIWRLPDDKAAETRAEDWLKRWLQIFHRAFAGFFSHNGFSNASSLTYTSLLTLVPLLAISLAVLKVFNVHETARDALKQLPIIAGVEVKFEASQRPPATLPVVGQLQGGPVVTPADAPDRVTGAQVIDKIFTFVENVDVGGLSAIGVVALLLSVLSLMAKIEGVMNDAWAVHRSRPIGRKLADYVNLLLVFVLLLGGLSTFATARVLTRWVNLAGRIGLPEAQQVQISHVFPYVAVWAVFVLAFIFMYALMPNTRVRWRSASASGLIAGTLFLLLQLVFVAFQTRLNRYDRIYGALGVVLFLLLWVYFSWCIMLWGVEVCSAHQNLRDWRRRRRPWHGTPAEHETLALRLAALVAAPLLRATHASRPDVAALADLLRLPPEPVGQMIELFHANGLLVQSADDSSYILARDPDELTVREVLRLVRQGRLEPAGQADGFLTPAALELADALDRQTVKDLAILPLEKIHTFTL